MKARVPFKARNPSGAAAMTAEIRRQCVELNAEYELDLDALVLWTLHEQNGWGCVRLMRFYDGLLANRKEMHDFYSGDTSDKRDIGIEYFAATQKLRQIGFDIGAVYQQLKKKYS